MSARKSQIPKVSLDRTVTTSVAGAMDRCSYWYRGSVQQYTPRQGKPDKVKSKSGVR